MERYIAFLRGINVSGQKLIKMEILRTVTTQAGFDQVKTYIQSGNLLFNSIEPDKEKLTFEIENLIEQHFGFRCNVILRKLSEIEAIVKLPIFDPLVSDKEKKYYITFLKNKPSVEFELPVYSKNKDIQIFHQQESELFTVCTLHKEVYGFPNAFIEKLTGIPATTRNPLTLGKIIKM